MRGRLVEPVQRLLPYRRRIYAATHDRGTNSMEIRFISSLTAEDENVVAPAVLKAVGALLDQFPIAYTIRIQTSGSQVFQHTHTFEPAESAAPANRDESEAGVDVQSVLPRSALPFPWRQES